ncbi:hypothetical protein AB0D04_25320 [Streptomyces sp. NPDC048483]|uniref:hypothetical protein n=1 Tax=Streptomyces sp. NPDC048483 TaxID=3154927 RepID=UPI003434E5E2
MAGTALPLVVTTPAQADATDCAVYMASKGYKVGPSVKKACYLAENTVNGTAFCETSLKVMGVRAHHAEEACRRGAR